MLQGSKSSRASCRGKKVIKHQMPTNLTYFMIDAEIALSVYSHYGYFTQTLISHTCPFLVT